MTSVQEGDVAPDPGFTGAIGLIQSRLRTQRIRLTLSVLAASASVALDLVPIWAVLFLITQVVAGSASSSDFALAALVLAISIPTSQALFAFATAQSHIAAFRMIRDLRLSLAEKLLQMPLGEVSGIGSGPARKLLVDEPEQMEPLIAHAIPEGLSALLMWLAVSFWLFVTDWRIGLVSVLLVPISFGAIAIGLGRSRSQMAAYQQANLRLNAAVAEFLRGIVTVKVFHRSGPALARVHGAVDDLVQVQSDWGRVFLPWGGTFYALIMANVTVVLPSGLGLLQTGRIDLHAFLLLVILGANYGAPLLRLFNLFTSLAHISAAVGSIQSLLARPEPEDLGGQYKLEGHTVRFETVSFRYDTIEALSEVSFEAPEGGVTALVGPSGAGKSTAALLLARFYDPTSGWITIGGKDIAELGQDQLRDTVGFVFQDTFLFRGTVLENLRFALPEASLAETQTAARAAQAHEFIKSLPQGYDTVIGGGTGLLSGGERQRLAIARAILKDAPVLVLDEATAFADPDNEAEIQRAISALATGKTVIVVAHRLHTIARADRIVVLEGGRCVAQGRHGDLLAKGGLYARMWRDHSATRDGGLLASPRPEAV